MGSALQQYLSISYTESYIATELDIMKDALCINYIAAIQTPGGSELNCSNQSHNERQTPEPQLFPIHRQLYQMRWTISY